MDYLGDIWTSTNLGPNLPSYLHPPTSSFFWTPFLTELRLGLPHKPSQTFGNYPWLHLLHPLPGQVHKPGGFGLLCVSRILPLLLPRWNHFGSQPPHFSWVAATMFKWPLCHPVCASLQLVFQTVGQRALSRKACPIMEFPCLKCSICCLFPAEKLSGLVHAHSFSPVSPVPPPLQDALCTAVCFPTPWPLHVLFLLSGTFCFPLLLSSWSNSCGSFWSRLTWCLFNRHLCTFAVCQAPV